jgi:putative heme-binding domain-containing protein
MNTMSMRTSVLTVAALALAASAWAQGHGYTPADIENGGQLYQANCTACHGPDGDGVPGINLGSGKFRRGTTDDEIVKIILGGVPGTAMPPNNFSESQAGTIVAYLRSLASSPAGGPTIPGDARRGRSLFEGKGQCQSCHSVGGIGGRAAPSLTEVGSSRRAVELQRALVDPSADIRSDSRQVTAVTREGATITGRLLNQDTYTLQLLQSNGRLTLLDKTTLREISILKESPMPSYKDKFNAQEIADVVAFLRTLRGRP